MSKKDEASYKRLASEIELDPSEIVYIDDNEQNIMAASKAGLQTIVFENNEDVKYSVEIICNRERDS